jgi:hypothetical protein
VFKASGVLRERLQEDHGDANERQGKKPTLNRATALVRASEAFERWRLMGGDDWQGNTAFLYSQCGS